jgi:hypothetical protein
VLEVSRTCPPHIYFYMCKSMNFAIELAHIEHTNQSINTVTESNYIHIVFLLFVALQTTTVDYIR